MAVKEWRFAGVGLGLAVALGVVGAVVTAERFEPTALAAEPTAGGEQKRGSAGGAVPLDAYLRRWQGIPADVQIEVGPARPGPVAGLEAVTVSLSRAGRGQTVEFFRSADGRYLLAGPLLDTTRDPHAALAARLDLTGRPSLGRSGAPITVVEYSSFQCPYCRKLAPVVKQTMEGPLGKEVRWVYKHFPLSTQAWSELAAVGAECARSIGGNAKFWPLHDFYFEQQDSFTPQNHRERAVAWAKSAGLPAKKFERCLDSPEALARVRADANEGQAIGVNSTPTLVINGRLAPGAVGAEELAGILRQELAYRRALAQAKTGGGK
jgi:protein-disulfide isomerase